MLATKKSIFGWLRESYLVLRMQLNGYQHTVCEHVDWLTLTLAAARMLLTRRGEQKWEEIC
jgi:hypothetical protein